MVESTVSLNYLDVSSEHEDPHSFFHSTLVKYKKGHYIFMPDEKGSNLYLVEKGRIKVASIGTNAKELIKQIAGPNDLIGLSALYEPTYNEYALPLEDVIIRQITTTKAKKLIRNNPSFSNWITCQSIRLIQNYNHRLESMVFHCAKRRIIDSILTLNEKHGDRVGYEYVIRRFITHQELANISATSRQTVTSVMNELRNNGYIKFNRRRLLIKDLDALANLI